MKKICILILIYLLLNIVTVINAKDFYTITEDIYKDKNNKVISKTLSTTIWFNNDRISIRIETSDGIIKRVVFTETSQTNGGQIYYSETYNINQGKFDMKYTQKSEYDDKMKVKEMIFTSMIPAIGSCNEKETYEYTYKSDDEYTVTLKLNGKYNGKEIHKKENNRWYISHYNTENKIKRKIQKYLDDNEKTVKTIRYDTNGNINSTITYKYDSDINGVIQTYYDGKGNKTGIEIISNKLVYYIKNKETFSKSMIKNK